MTRRFTLAAIMLAVAAAAAPVARAQDAKVYGKPYEVVWRASLDAARASGLEVLSDDRQKGLIVARGGVSAFGWGESVDAPRYFTYPTPAKPLRIDNVATFVKMR